MAADTLGGRGLRGPGNPLGGRLSLHYSVARSLISGLVGAWSGWKVEGREHVPATGGLIVASNHISFWDPPLVGTAVRRELHFLAKEELFRNPVFGSIIRSFNAIPIRRGVADMSGLTKAMDVLRAGKALILFPEGSRMRDGKLHRARPGLGMLAAGTGARVLPCYISGSDQSRSWLLRRARPHVRIGVARTWQELAGEDAGLEPGRALYQSVSDGLMREIAALKAAGGTTATPGASDPRSHTS